MAKKNFSKVLETSIHGREEIQEDIPVEIKEETKLPLKTDDTEERQIKPTRLDPPPGEQLNSGIVISGKYGYSKIRRTVNMEGDLYEKVESLAKEHHISFSMVVNQILRQVL